MAILFKDGFDYLVQADLSKKWDNVTGLIASPGVYGNGKAYNPNGANTLTKTLAANVTTGFFSFHFFYSSVAALTIFAVTDAGTAQIDLRCDATGALFFTRNGTTIGSVGAVGTRLVANSYYWFCGKIVIDATVGVAELKVNNAFVLNSGVTNLNTKNSANSFFNQVNLKANSLYNFDSFHVWDTSTTGGALGGYPAGELIIDTQLPSAAGSSAGWTRGGTNSGANYSQVNEANEDGDTKYNVSSTPAQIDSFLVGNLNATSGTIVDVGINTIDRIDDGTARVIKHRVKSSSSTVESAGISPAAGYLNHQSSFPQDPATSAAWTVAGRNAAEFGYDLIS